MRLFDASAPFAHSLIAVCGLAMICTACGSNNKGKIEGKWKVDRVPDPSGKAKRRWTDEQDGRLLSTSTSRTMTMAGRSRF